MVFEVVMECLKSLVSEIGFDRILIQGLESTLIDATPIRKPRQQSVIVKPGGKGIAIRRLNPATGKVEAICECRYNVDFSRGCIGQVFGPLIQEVLDNYGVYAYGNFNLYKAMGLVNKKCGYCYSYRNTGNVLSKKVDGKTRKSFEEHRPDVIRISKITEAGHAFYFKELMKFFDLCEEFGSRVLFPTKMFSFGIEGAREVGPVMARYAGEIGMLDGEEIAKKLRLIDASLLYSLGWDNQEVGNVSQGFTNQWRINQALAYAKQEVNVSLTIVCDVTRSIEDNVDRGSYVAEALKLRDRVNVRLLPLRPKRKVTESLCGGTWEEVLRKAVTQPFDGLDILSHSRVPYRRRGNNEAFPLYFHADFQELVDEGVGVCGTVGKYESCDKCNLYSRDQWERFPACEIPPVDYSGKTKKSYGKKGKRGKKNDKQKKLF